MLFACALWTLAGSGEFTFVRHGETVANATGKYNSRSLNALSAKGQREVKALTAELLAEPKFDLILVSPSPRALKTIAPYLEASHQTAVVWPLLYECCTARRPKGAHATKFSYGPRIAIPIDLKPYFSLMPGETRFPEAASYNAGLAQVDAAVGEFRRKFAHGRMLLVGHSGQGGHFIHALTGRWIKLDNAKTVSVRYP